MVLMILILRPYKKIAHNFTYLMTMILLLAYAFGAVYIPIISVLCIPFLVLCLYFPYRLVKHCCVQTICKNKTERNTANEPPPEEQAPFYQLHQYQSILQMTCTLIVCLIPTSIMSSSTVRIIYARH